MTPIVYPKMLAIISSGQKMSKFDAAKAIPCHHQTARRILSRLHKEKQIYIVGWTYSYQQPIPIYVFGQGKDKPRPKPLTSVQTSRRYRAKPENHEQEIKQKRVKRIIEGAYQSKAQDQIFNLIVKRAA